MNCKRCNLDYEKWLPVKTPENNLCLSCNEAKWEEWNVEHTEELNQIKEIQTKGHSHHCACRQVWGDGECECDLYEKGYDPYAWIPKSPEIEKELIKIGGKSCEHEQGQDQVSCKVPDKTMPADKLRCFNCQHKATTMRESFIVGHDPLPCCDDCALFYDFIGFLLTPIEPGIKNSSSDAVIVEKSRLTECSKTDVLEASERNKSEVYDNKITQENTMIGCISKGGPATKQRPSWEDGNV